MVSGLTLTLGVASSIKIEPTFAQVSAAVARRNPSLDPPIVQRLEKTLGKPLTPQQRRQVVEAATQTVRQLLAVQEQTAEQIAAITGLALPDARSLLPNLNQPLVLDKPFLERLTRSMGKPPSSGQRQILDLVARRRQQILLPKRERFAYQVAQITGLSISRVKQLLAQRNTDNPIVAKPTPKPAAAVTDNDLRPSRGSAADISGTSSRSDREILSR